MTRWILAIVAILMLSASASFGQGLTANIYYYSNGGAPLTTECEGATPLPDGRIIRIYQDINWNDPDPIDTQPVVCDNPPECLDGPVGTVNFNEFTMNGVEQGLGAGYLWTSPMTFQSFGALPPGLQRYYLRVYEADGTTVLWTSTIFWLTTGYQEVELFEADWTCGQGGVQCLVIDETE